MVPPERYANGNGAVPYPRGMNTLPAVELTPFILTWLGDRDLRARQDRVNGRMMAGITDLADLSGVSERRIYAILHGEQDAVHVDTADKLCTALAVPLALVYPEARESA